MIKLSVFQHSNNEDFYNLNFILKKVNELINNNESC